MKSFITFIVIVLLLTSASSFFYMSLMPIAEKEHYENSFLISSVGMLPSRAIIRFLRGDTKPSLEKKEPHTESGFILEPETASGSFMSEIRKMTGALTNPTQ